MVGQNLPRWKTSWDCTDLDSKAKAAAFPSAVVGGFGEVARRARKILFSGGVWILLVEQVVERLQAELARVVGGLVVPEVIANALVIPLNILPATPVDECPVRPYPVKFIDGYLTGLLKVVGAVARASGSHPWGAPSTGHLPRARGVVAVPQRVRARPRKAVPDCMLVVDLVVPLPRRELADIVAAHKVAVGFPVLGAVRQFGAPPVWPSAPALVKCEAHPKVHTLAVERLRRPRLDLVALNPRLAKSPRNMPDNLVVEVPESPGCIGKVLIRWLVALLVLRPVHVEGVEGGAAGLREVWVVDLVPSRSFRHVRSGGVGLGAWARRKRRRRKRRSVGGR
mmetsp:Transcript_60326/g.161525  ORF Transcript_60326/g.161525 Transcript_60326/m.161525 type:complete len:339 (+) Transcript_60326:25-1041(+)